MLIKTLPLVIPENHFETAPFILSDVVIMSDMYDDVR